MSAPEHNDRADKKLTKNAENMSSNSEFDTKTRRQSIQESGLHINLSVAIELILDAMAL